MITKQSLTVFKRVLATHLELNAYEANGPYELCQVITEAKRSSAAIRANDDPKSVLKPVWDLVDVELEALLTYLRTAVPPTGPITSEKVRLIKDLVLVLLESEGKSGRPLPKETSLTIELTGPAHE